MADMGSQLLLGSGLTVLSHPLMYVKMLVQVGHEPLPPTLGRNLFGRQVYQLPGLFAYAKHIISIDGKSGLFKGLTPRLCAGVVGTVVHSKVLQSYHELEQKEESDIGHKERSTSLDHVIKETTQEMVARSAATLITHPFHVITLRCMVQFIGRETKYNGVFGSVVTIYREEGILGFFAGLIPRLLGDIFSLWICNMVAYLINTYALENGAVGEMKSYSQAVTGPAGHISNRYAITPGRRMPHRQVSSMSNQGKRLVDLPLRSADLLQGQVEGHLTKEVGEFLASMLTYPFLLVSNLMAVNNCGLVGGSLPYAPPYTSWIDCWSQLSKEGNMSRGNSLFFRKVPSGKKYIFEQKRFY